MKINKDSALYFVSFCGVLAAMTHAMLSNLFKLPLSQFKPYFYVWIIVVFYAANKGDGSKKAPPDIGSALWLF